MMQGMTTNAGGNPSELFLQQMIPHHADAVQMAKSLLKIGELQCDNYEDETAECILDAIAREVITNQNFQIQTMSALYEALTDTVYNETQLENIDCIVEFRKESERGAQPVPCFSAFTTAFVNGKGSVTMDLIEVGDSVLTGNGEFQSVYSIDHRDISKSTAFLQIAFGSDNNVLEITPNHMIFKEGSEIPVPSATVNVGDKVATPSGYEKVISVKTIERKGVFNPLTADGTIVASGMVASTFSSLLNQSESIEISGRSVMSYQQFFTNLLKPYKFFCTTLSLELCRVESGKVMVSGLASRIFFLHYGDSAYQASLLSTIAFILSFMEKLWSADLRQEFFSCTMATAHIRHHCFQLLRSYFHLWKSYGQRTCVKNFFLALWRQRISGIIAFNYCVHTFIYGENYYSTSIYFNSFWNL